MRRVLVVIVIAIVAGAGAASQPTPPPAVLTAIDSVPTQSQLYDAFGSGSSAMAELVMFAQDSTDPGTQLRAIHALVSYCTPTCQDTDAPHVTLHNIIIASPTPETGTDLLVLRGAIESLGLMRDPNDMNQLAGFLNHSNRDIRAAAALALRDLCDTNAISALRARTPSETDDQVKLAISAALRALSTNPPTCQ